MTTSELARDLLRALDDDHYHPTLRPFVRHVIDLALAHLVESDALNGRVCASCDRETLVCTDCEPGFAPECPACLNPLDCPHCNGED